MNSKIFVLSFLLSGVWSTLASGQGDLANIQGEYQNGCDLVTISKSEETGGFEAVSSVREGHGCPMFHLVERGRFSMEEKQSYPFPIFRIKSVLREGNGNVPDLTGATLKFNIFPTGSIMYINFPGHAGSESYTLIPE